MRITQNVFASMQQNAQQQQINSERQAAQKSYSAETSLIRFVDDPTLRMILFWLAKTSYKNKMKEIYQQQTLPTYSNLHYEKLKTWSDWLKNKAEQGDSKALKVLQARENNGIIDGNYLKIKDINKQEQLQNFQNNFEKFHISKHGTLIVPMGKTNFRTDGEKIQLGYGSTMENWNQILKNLPNKKIEIHGQPNFVAKVVRIVAEQKLPIVFADENLNTYKTNLERKYNERRAKQQYESRHSKRNDDVDGRLPNRDRRDNGEFADRNKQNGGQFTRRNSNIGTRSNAGFAGNANTRNNRASSNAGNTTHATTNRELQSNSTQFGKVPPPKFRDSLRALPECDVVSFAQGSEMLLQGNVSNNVVNERTKPDSTMRWESAGGTTTTNLKTEQVSTQAPSPQQHATQSHIQPAPSFSKEKQQKEMQNFTKEQSKAKTTISTISTTPSQSQSLNYYTISNTENPTLELPFFTAQQVESAREYIKERDEKRAKGMKDILIHELFNNEFGIYEYKGARSKNNDNFILLENNNKIKMLPISNEIFAQLKNKRGLNKVEIVFNNNNLDIKFISQEIKKDIECDNKFNKKSPKR